MDQAAVARHRLEAMEARTGSLCRVATPRRRPGTWRHKLPAARMAPGGSRTALRLTLLYPLAPCGPLAWLPSRCRGLLNPPNRRIRTRTSGGVGGEESRDSPLSRLGRSAHQSAGFQQREPRSLGRGSLVAALRYFFVWGAFHSPEAPTCRDNLEQAKAFHAHPGDLPRREQRTPRSTDLRKNCAN